MDAMRQEFLDDRCSQGSGRGSCSTDGFIPRDSKEPVRNCSQVDRGLSQFIVSTVANHLLLEKCLVSCESGSSVGEDTHEEDLCQSGDCHSCKSRWNVGGECSLTMSPYISSSLFQEDSTSVRQLGCLTRKCWLN